MPAPTVSVIMPFLNSRAFIEEAIESVQGQTWTSWELLLVDDGSADGSAALAHEYARRDPRIRLLRHPDGRHHGASAARNLALAHARGEFVAFLDSDDVWLPENLAEQLRRLRSTPEAGVLYSATLYWYGWATPAEAADHVPPHLVTADRPISGLRLLELCVTGNATVPCTCSMLVRRGIVDRVGGFEDRFIELYTDQVFYSKLFAATTVLPVSGWWARYRQHPRSSTMTAARERRAREARRAFLVWLEEYVRRLPGAPPSLLRAVRRELWRSHHRLGDYLLDQLTFLRRRFIPGTE